MVIFVISITSGFGESESLFSGIADDKHIGEAAFYRLYYEEITWSPAAYNASLFA